MSIASLTEDQAERLLRLADEHDRQARLGDMASDDYFERMWGRPHMMASLITLLPKEGEPWEEGRMLLWLEIVEKTARLVYGLRSDTDDIFCPDPSAHHVESPARRIRANAEADRLEPARRPETGAEEEPDDEPAQEESQVDASDSSASDEEPRSEAPGPGFGPDGPEETDQTEAEAAEPAPAEPDQDQPGGWLARQIYKGPLHDRIPAALREAGRPLTKDELYDALDQKRGVGAKLGWLVKDGTVTIDEEGRYALGDGEPRRCADDDCETVLSVYNDGEYCSVHESQEVAA